MDSRGFQVIARSAGRRLSNINALYSWYRVTASSARRRLNAPEGMTGQGPRGVLNTDEWGTARSGPQAGLCCSGFDVEGLQLSPGGRLSGLLGVQSSSDTPSSSSTVCSESTLEGVSLTVAPGMNDEGLAFAEVSSSLPLSISRLGVAASVERSHGGQLEHHEIGMGRNQQGLAYQACLPNWWLMNHQAGKSHTWSAPSWGRK